MITKNIPVNIDYGMSKKEKREIKKRNQLIFDYMLEKEASKGNHLTPYTEIEHLNDTINFLKMKREVNLSDSDMDIDDLKGAYQEEKDEAINLRRYNYKQEK